MLNLIKQIRLSPFFFILRWTKQFNWFLFVNINAAYLFVWRIVDLLCIFVKLNNDRVQIFVGFIFWKKKKPWNCNGDRHFIRLCQMDWQCAIAKVNLYSIILSLIMYFLELGRSFQNNLKMAQIISTVGWENKLNQWKIFI